MKQIKLSIAIIGAISLSSLFTNCQSSSDKDKSKAEEVKQDLKETQQDAAAAADEAWKHFKMDADIQIKENEARIEAMKEDMKKSKKKMDAAYKEKVDKLEEKNMQLRDKINEYDKQAKSDWESFKREFNHDMEELGKALKDLTVDNKK